MPQPRILIADDEPIVLEFITQALSSQSWVVELARDGREALDLLSSKHFDVAVLDLRMPHICGMQVLQAAQERGIETDVLILTGHGTIPRTVKAMRSGAKDFLTKPFKAEELIDAIERLLAKHYPSEHPLASELDAFVRANASNSELILGDISRNFKISDRYVSKLFKEHIGMTFRRRLAYYRVEKAKALMKSSNERLHIVAQRCGFRNYRHLTATFHRLEGMSPSEYRVKFGQNID